MATYDVKNTGIQLLNSTELGKLFDELTPAIQSQIVKKGLRDSGNIILQQVKANFQSRYNLKDNHLLKCFVNQAMQTKVGQKIGVKGGEKGYDGYIIRFLEYGTNDRTQKKSKRFTGKLKAGHFFSDAVDSTKDQAVAGVQDAIVASFEKTVAKYANKK